MNKLLLILSILCIYSCKENEGNHKKDISKSDIVNPLADPTEFVGDYKTKVMILGLFHFDNPGKDDYKEKYEIDILSPKKQKELNEVLDKIVLYKPTKILLEVPRIKGDSIFNHRYQEYLKSEFDIGHRKNEWYQIGFKLAKRLNHNRIYAVDARSKWFGADMDWDNYNSDEYQKSLGQYKKANRYNYDRIYEMEDSLKTIQTLTDHFIMINNSKNRLKDHQAYLTNTALTGAGDLYIGVDGVARWYQRNLKIFANTYDITDFSKEERLLLIYGAGHVWQLRQFFTDSPDFEYIEVNDYLIK